MQIEVRRLNRDMAEEYIRYFDHRAFADGNPEKGCYCVWHHWTDRHEHERSLMPENQRPSCKREYARKLIEDGTLNGFAAFDGDQMIGFCNADLKDHYFRLSRENNAASWTGADEKDRILSIVCYIVAPDWRRKGVAKALLDGACRYARENGYDHVEGYPPRGAFSERDCGGSLSMYVNAGFEIIDVPGGVIARKSLKAPKP
ncbi:MAG: GNAT family N-acetyltransferase [Christensenellaceae bacterium]|nr:GNAT family N-acetyltransferase [Christensenellaceae bacterium]